MAKTTLETGSTLDGFVIGELVHRGGMGIVRLPIEREREVALEVLVPGIDPGRVGQARQLLREALIQ